MDSEWSCLPAVCPSEKCTVNYAPSCGQVHPLRPPPTLSLPGIRVRAVTNANPDVEFSAREIVTVVIEHEDDGECIKVGNIKIDLVDIARARCCGFLTCLEGLSADLANLAKLHFDNQGRLHPGGGPSLAAFNNERYIAFIDEFLIEKAWRGRGLGSWLLPRLFQFENLRGAQFIFTRPDVLHYTDSDSRYSPPPVGRDGEALFLRIVRFYQRAGFCRLGNSQFFCRAKDISCPTSISQ
ncbi:hypothetical protein C8R45DRAFT_979699 [Mycena sanguinolenta]|nr:hypothetical protein C8R45DRAFT_979699 [Mycena sanguinolenta]